jgi:site-specific DNA recombinase
VREGLAGGGLTYGYAPVVGERGKRTIVEAEAVIVQRIFAEYVAGRTPREIAIDLNREQVPAPRGDFWGASTIHGNRKRGSGLLSNALYDGRLVWNKVGMRKDPKTGKRVSRINPEASWQTTAVPHLRIVDTAVFAAAQALMEARGHEAPSRARKPRHLLSGLLRCGCCGHALVVKDRDSKGRRLYCSRMREGGRCTNGRAFYVEHRELFEVKRAHQAFEPGMHLGHEPRRARMNLDTDKFHLFPEPDGVRSVAGNSVDMFR